MANDALLQEWSNLSESERVEAFKILLRDRADEFFLQLSSQEQIDLLLALSQGQRQTWLRLLPPDDAADLIQLAPEGERDQLAAH